MPKPAHETQSEYRIVLIQPEAYAHSGALSELAETLLYGFNALGLSFQLNINETDPGCTNILLGAHLLDAHSLGDLPPGSIIYNSEQIDQKSSWISATYLDALRKFEVWDYSEENIRRLLENGIKQIKYVPVGYVPQLTRIPVLAQDIDVLFYGAINERRKAILEALIARGLRIEFLSGVYREERDHYIARAKLVLNLHYYEASVFEVVRVSYLLANEKAVVAECGEHTTLDADLREAVCGVPYEQLVNTCVELVADSNKRANLAQRGFELFAQRVEATILAQALGIKTEVGDKHDSRPTLLNLGSGKDWRENCLNVDINADFRPDAILDIAKPLTDGQLLATQRFGTLTLRDNMLDAIFANDVLEHIPDLTAAMSNCLRLLKPGGTFHIHVPYELSLGAWQDPTHIRAFNENSWLYYTDWYWYMGWTEAKFDCLSTEFRLSPLGETLSAAGKTLEDILRTPRAVDGMSVILRKRYLLESEIERSSINLQRPWDSPEGAPA